jgi:hypothetical protein
MEYIDRKSFRSKSWAAKATKTDSRFYQGATGRNGNLLPTLPPQTYFFEGHKQERLTTSVAFKTPCKAMKDSGLERFGFPRIRFGILLPFARSRQ